MRVNLLSKLMNKHMAAERAVRKQPKKRRFAPYFLGSPCERFVQYMYTLTEPDYPMTVECAWHAKSGQLHHHWMREEIIKAFEGTKHKLLDYVTPKGKTLWNPFDKAWDYEFPLVRKKIGIPKSKIDGVSILDIKGEKQLWLLEYKTATKTAYEYYLNKPKDDHMQQGMICWDMFNDNLKMGKFKHIKELKPFKAAEGVIFLYVLKDSPFKKKEFPIKGNPEFVAKIKKKLLRIKKASKAGKLLPGTENFCDTCEFRDKCEDNYVPEVLPE